jgi:hypothetical protein
LATGGPLLTAKSSTDTGTSVDSSTLATALSSIDTASAQDSATVHVVLSELEGATGTDAESSRAHISSSDTSAALETALKLRLYTPAGPQSIGKVLVLSGAGFVRTASSKVLVLSGAGSVRTGSSKADVLTSSGGASVRLATDDEQIAAGVTP